MPTDFSTLSAYLVVPSWTKFLVALCILLAVQLVVWRATGTLTLGLLAALPSLFLLSILGWFPLWSVVLGCLLVGGSLLATSSSTGSTVYLKNWEAFGNRLKEAYIAKFGYANSSFDEEIDNHVRIMQTMGKGFEMGTKEAAEDWLKRMAHMVEVPYIIPEEECLPESKKTEQFAKE